MTPSDDLREAVFDFVAEHRSVDRSRLSGATTLFGDLGIDGDDGYELLLAFSRRFDVDMTACDANRYFGPEGGCMPIAPLYWLFTAYRRKRYGMTEEESCGLTAVTIDDLVAAAVSGKWKSVSV